MVPGGRFLNRESGAGQSPVGIWLSLAANLLGLCVGAVFLLSAPGSRFRGMESEARAFVSLLMLAVPLGLFAGLPLSLYDYSWRHKRLWGSVGALLAFTPLPVALAISDLIAEQRDLLFE